tara:strand:- start:62 stop:541 length:480 start_codon:yes stop_codon:yes gene_type:complete
MLYECKNNFLPNDEHAKILTSIIDERFPWYKVYLKNSFKHEFYKDEKPVSPYIELIDGIKKAHKKPLISACAHMFLPMKQEYEILFNKELLENNDKTILTIHLNESDGRTILTSLNQGFKSEQNRAVFMDGRLSIAETCPVASGYRLIMTCLFKKTDIY